MVRQPAVLSIGGLIEYVFDAGAMDYLFEALHGTAIRYAAEKRNPAESIAELREIANGHDDILAEAGPAPRPARGTPARLPVSGMS
jgi:hypothetical protein